MTRPRDIKAAEREAQLQEAIAAVQNKEHTCHSAAIAFNVPRRTLYHRVKGNKKPRNQAHEQAQNLTHAEEKELVRWIGLLTRSGYLPRYSTLQRLAEIIRERRVKETGEVQTRVYDKIGEQWVRRFLARHPELASVRPRSIDAARVKDCTPERLRRWFDDLEKVIKEYNIKPKNIYNMDESGFAIGETEPARCIINTQIRQRFQAKPGRQEWVSVAECVCADGTVIPPLVIFKAENLSTEWIPASIHGDWRFSCNSKGWTSNQHGLDWLTRCFDPQTHDKAVGEYRLLICDGHDSHITAEWIAHCIDNDILLMILPPHSSHLTQPLDVGIFGPLKKHMAAEIAPLIQLGVSRVRKVEWLTAFVSAHNKALCAKNILGGFRGTGIHPFSPTKVLRRVASSPPPQTPPQPSTPYNSVTAFNEAVLTSSPNDYNAVHQANVALNTLIDSGQPIPTPAKKYVNCLTRHVMRLHTRNSLVEKENEEHKALNCSRKRRLSGKRQVIDGKHLISAAELVGVKQAEEATRQRKAPKKAKGKGKGRSKASEKSSNESDVSLDMVDDEDVELLDCIEVEMELC